MTVPGTSGNPLVVQGSIDSSATEITATTYTSGLLTAYTERRPTDQKTRTWTITRNGDGTINTSTVTAWA